MFKWLTPNRVAAISGELVAIGTLVASFDGVIPHSWVTTTAAVIGAVVIVLHFMTGSQKYDALLSEAKMLPLPPDEKDWILEQENEVNSVLSTVEDNPVKPDSAVKPDEPVNVKAS